MKFVGDFLKFETGLCPIPNFQGNKMGQKTHKN